MNQDMQFLTYRKKKIVYKICHLNEFLILKSTIIGFSLITSRGPSSSSEDVFHRAKKTLFNPGKECQLCYLKWRNLQEFWFRPPALDWDLMNSPNRVVKGKVSTTKPAIHKASPWRQSMSGN